MAIINEPVLCNDVDFKFKDKWCKSQALWKKNLHEKPIICLAYLNEGRVFTGGFAGPDDPNLKHCQDYERKKK